MRLTHDFLKKLSLILTSLFVSLFFAVNELVYASGEGDPLDFRSFMKTIYGIIFPAVVIIGFFKVVIAGYNIMTSEGDPQKIQGGKEDLTAAIMGMIFILGAVGILRILVGSIISGGNPGF
jgi:hypothetical protein